MGVYTHQLYDNTLYINKIQKTLRFHVTKIARLNYPTDLFILYIYIRPSISFWDDFMMDASKNGTKSPKARPSDIEIVIFMSDGQSTHWLGNLICQPVFPVDPNQALTKIFASGFFFVGYFRGT